MSAKDLTADLYFASALRAGADRSGTRLLALADLKEPLAPHGRFAQRMLLVLQSLGYIEPELSLSWAEDWLDSRDWVTHGFENISWRIVRSPQVACAALRAWAEGMDVSSSMLKVWVAIWQDLALAEVAEYTRCSLADIGFDPNWSTEAMGALRAGIEQFSVHEVMYLVYIALRSLALEHRRNTPRGGTLSHRFSSALARYVRRATSEKWAIRGLSHAPDLPRSAITVVFADTVTGLGDRYYSDRPCLEFMAKAITSRHS